MASLQRGQVETFINITGASEAEAREKLQAFRGDINAAIDSYLSEKENSVAPVRVEEADTPGWLDMEEPPSTRQRAAQSFYPLPSPPTWSRMLPGIRGFGFEGTMASRFPNRGTSPFVTQPRDIQEIPIDWKDEEPRVQSSPGLTIEEIPATAESSTPPQTHPHFVSNDDDDAPRPFSNIFRRTEARSRPDGITSSSDLNARQGNSNRPLVDDGMDVKTINESGDIEEEMLKAVLEASKKETTGKGFSESSSGAGVRGSQSDAEDEDFLRAVSLSLKTAEQEKAWREGKGFALSEEFGDFQDDTQNDEVSKRNSVEENDELEEQPLLRRRSGRALNSVPGGQQELRDVAGRPLYPTERNRESTSNDEWGGLSAEEQEEAVLLEAAMFGQVSDDSAVGIHYPAAFGGIAENANGSLGSLPDSNGYQIERPLQRSPSPSVIAQRLLREQQDDEYLASLVADREKEERAQREEEMHRLKEVQTKAAADKEERVLREEQLRKRLAEQEMEKQKSAKQAALPEEPRVDHENAVTIMVRLPDGARQGRRFLKSEPLKCLLDFIDVSCGPLPGPYQLVRPYPRRAFTDVERGISFQELGLNSKYETLFLEVL